MPANQDFASLVIRHPVWSILLPLVLVLIAISGAKHLSFNDDYRSFFSEKDPYRAAYEQLERTYNDSDILILVVTPSGGDAFAPEFLSIIEELTEASWRLPAVMRVDSLTNYQYSYAEEDDLVVEDLFASDLDLSAEDINKRRQAALSEPEILGRLISASGAVTAVVLTAQGQENRSEEQYQLVLAARELSKDFEARYANIDIRMSGDMMMGVTFREVSEADARTLIPFMMLAIIAVVFFLLRSLVATLGLLLISILSVLFALGMSGWLGIDLSPTTSSAPVIILTLAVADGIHLLMGMFRRLRAGEATKQAVEGSLRGNLRPIFLTSLTTAIGLATFNFNESPPFQDLGNVTAIGIFAAWLLSVTLLPAFLSFFNFNGKNLEATEANQARAIPFSRFMANLAEWVIRNRKSVLIGGMVFNLGVLALISLNEANDQFLQYFGEDIAFRQDTEYTIANLTGINRLLYSIPAKGTNSLSEPEYLKQMDQLTQWLRTQPEVTHVDSLSDVFKRLNKNMHDDDQAFYRVPEDRELAAQYLLLYELSLPFGLDLNNRINVDKSASKLVVSLIDLSTRDMREIEQRIEQWMADNTPSLQAVAVGPDIMFSHISQRTIRSMILGTLLGMVLISLILIAALQSLKLGLLSLMTNVLPAALAFGFWGAFVGQVNMSVSIVAAMSLGIVVDDTVHFLNRYLHLRRVGGLSGEDAIRETFASVGVALLVTSVAFCIGFLILGLSDFVVNANMANMTAMAILLALFVDFLLLPPLLLQLDKDKLGKSQ